MNEIVLIKIDFIKEAATLDKDNEWTSHSLNIL